MARLILIEDLVGPASIGRGGHSMYVRQWVAALERCGHDVWFIEFLDKDLPPDPSGIAHAFGESIRSFAHPERCALVHAPTVQSLWGLPANELETIAEQAEAVILLAAHYRREPYPIVDSIRPRLLIEQDPGYTHLWAATGDPRDIFGTHDFYFTVGGNIGSPRCLLPTLGLKWRPTWNPVIMEWWAGNHPITRDRFTTVADWRSYGYLEFQGTLLGPKAEEFKKFIDLPARAGQPIEIALNIDGEDEDLAVLRSHGWNIEDPAVVSTPEAYVQYVTGSAGEFSCTKGGYAGTNGGWFSDRSACYLAAGRPVILQATGFADLLPTGQGLFSVRTVDEAADAIANVRGDYAMHCRAARQIAQDHFSAEVVISRILKVAGIGDSKNG